MKTSARLVLFAAALLVVNHDRPALGTTAGFALSATHLTADGISTGTVRLSTLSVTSMPSFATRAWVKSVGDWFTLSPTTGAAADGATVITAADGRQWVRQFIPNPKWRIQATWSIDESNATGLASDENTCADDAHPCLTIDEFVRRMQKQPVTGTIVVRWLSDTTHVQVNLSAMAPGHTPLPLPEGYPAIVFMGVPTVLRTGTLTGATTAPWTVSDSTLTTSWAASGLLSSSSGTRMIRKTDKTKHAFLAYENVAKTAQTSPANGFTEDPVWFPAGTPSATFSAGDAYEVLSLPKFPRVTPPDYSASYGASVFVMLDMDGILGDQVEVRNCGFRQLIPDLNGSTRSGVLQVHGAIFVQGFIVSAAFASNTMDRALMMGQVTLATYNGDLNGAVNVIAKDGRVFIVHASHPRLGTFYVYDTTFNPVIQVSNNSDVSIDALHGSGNSGVLVDVRDSGCSVNSVTTTPLTAFDATTSAAHPISVVGTQYDYANLPVSFAGGAATFATNAAASPAAVGDYRAFAIKRAQALNIFAAPPTIFEDNFQNVPGDAGSQFQILTQIGAAGTVTGTGAPGGVIRLDSTSGANKGILAQVGKATGTKPTVIADPSQSGTRWYLLWVFSIASTPDTKTVATLNLQKASPAGNELFMGFDAQFASTTKFMVEDNSGAIALSSVVPGTAGTWHYMEAWQLGTANQIFVRFDNEAPVTFNAGAPAFGAPLCLQLESANGSPGSQVLLDVDHVVVLMSSSVALPAP